MDKTSTAKIYRSSQIARTASGHLHAQSERELCSKLQ